MTGAEQRDCPACGTAFTWTPAALRQRFCSTPCRQRWWDRTRRQRSRRRQPDDPHGHDPRRPQDSSQRRQQDDDPRGHDGPAIAAVPACPHCRKPVAIVAWLVPPAAAVATPTRHASQNTLRTVIIQVF